MRAQDAEKFYTAVVDEKFGADYEGERWHKDAHVQALYEMTKESVVALCADDPTLRFSRMLELGAGAGTWTREVVTRHKGAAFDFVDISPVMLKKVEDAMRALGVDGRYFVSDFNAFTPDTTYDLFFSIRALEYVADKGEAMEKIARLLARGGRGFIITKTPHYLRARLRGRTYSSLHQGQITPLALAQLAKRAGLTDIALYPVTFTIPFVRNARLARALFSLFGKRPLSLLSQFFSESYAISFKKP